jgi:hypothetical protein
MSTPYFGSCLLLLALAFPAAADEVSDLQDQLRAKDAEIARLKAEQGNAEVDQEVDMYLESTEQTGDRPFAGQQADQGWGSERVRIGGYFSLEYRDEDGKNSEFDFHRLVLLISADIAEAISFRTEIEFEGGGADVDFLDGNEILIEYAELQFDLIEDNLNFIVGVVLIPWGRFNFYHDDPMNDLTDRPLVARRIGAIAFGQPGVALSGLLATESNWFFDYKLALVQGFGEEFTTNGGSRSARQSFRSDNNHNKQVFGRLVIAAPVSFLDVLEFGGSATYGKWDDNNDHADYGWGVEMFAKRGAWEFTAEYMAIRIEQDPAAPATDPRRQSGWYVQVGYHFFPDAWRGRHALLTDESTFTLTLRVEEIDLNDATTGSTFRDDLFQTTIGLNFRPVERTVFKVDFVWVDSEQPDSPEYRVLLSWATYF